MKKYAILLSTLIIFGCGEKTIQVGENVFVHKDKVYKLIDNEIIEISDLTDTIRKLEVLKPIKKDFDGIDLSIVKYGSKADIKTLYRGNVLYFKFKILGLLDLKESYYPGNFTLQFKDEFGFILHSIRIGTDDLVGMHNGDVLERFEYNGGIEMSSDINHAIKSISITSTVKKYNSIFR